MELSRRSFLRASGAALAGAGALSKASDESATGEDITDEEIAKVRAFIREQWNLTIRHSDPSNAAETALPKPFTVPTAGKMFHYFFYWDTYFTSIGLLLDTMEEQARNNADAMIYLTGKLRFIPNINVSFGENRTQLPVSSALYADVFRWSEDTEWLKQAYSALEREYAFFQSMRMTPCGLNRGYHHATPAYLWQFAEEIRPRLPHLPSEPVAKLNAAGHALAECEVWDFTPRFGNRCADFCPLDTNALLYLMETNAARFSERLGNGQSSTWKKRADRRRALITELCWNENQGFFFDYDWLNRRQGEVISAANFFILWCGAATPEQAKRVAQNLKLLEYPHGITTCVPGEHSGNYQWDHPNAWPPLQFAAIEGLRRYGFTIDAKRVACKYVATVCRNFRKTGNLWEKYNVVTGALDVRNEYDMPPMLGWTAGVFLHALKFMNSLSEIKVISGAL